MILIKPISFLQKDKMTFDDFSAQKRKRARTNRFPEKLIIQ